MALAIWIGVLLGALGFAYWATRLVQKNEAEDRFDAGLAIVEFGQAYPDEAIRQVQMSVDGEIVFLRLWTGKIGCMRRNGARYLCHLLDPGRVHVTPTEDGCGLHVDFPGIKALTGDFRFRSPREAAEVSLWVLGSFTVAAGPDLIQPNHA